MTETTAGSWGKCNDCDAEAVTRFREMPTKRQEEAGKPGKLIAQYCRPHAYASEVETSPWRIMLPVERTTIYTEQNGHLPPVRLLDGRLYNVAAIDRHPPKGPTTNRPFYDVDPGTLLYRPKLKAWVRKEGRTLVVVSKEAYESGPMAKHFYEALTLLPVDDTGGKVHIVLRADAATASTRSPRYHIGLLWLPNPR